MRRPPLCCPHRSATLTAPLPSPLGCSHLSAALTAPLPSPLGCTHRSAAPWRAPRHLPAHALRPLEGPLFPRLPMRLSKPILGFECGQGVGAKRLRAYPCTLGRWQAKTSMLSSRIEKQVSEPFIDFPADKHGTARPPSRRAAAAHTHSSPHGAP